MGDSGTHSDTESERKIRSSPSNGFCHTYKAKEILEDYDVPPPNPICFINNNNNGNGGNNSGNNKQKCSATNGILNYDIPPPSLTLSDYSFKQNWDNESCISTDSLNATNEVNYYNLLGKDVAITPNQSTLHSRLAKGPSKNLLKSVEENNKKTDDDNNCYEYINLPSLKDDVDDGETISGKSEFERKLLLSREDNDDEEPERNRKNVDVNDVNDDVDDDDNHLPDYVNVENGVK